MTPIDYSFNAMSSVMPSATRFYLDEVTIDGAANRHGPFDLGSVYGAQVGEEMEQRLYLPICLSR